MKNLDFLQNKWKNWPYKNTVLLIISLIVFFYFADTDFVKNIIKTIGNFGYLGAFITGIFFVSAFTVVPAMAVLYDLVHFLNPLAIALFAGLGTVLGDYLIFRFLKDKVFEELAPIFDRMGGSLIKKLFFTPYFIWLLPFLGAFIITSPLPDEAGIGLLGLSKIKNWQFLLLTFLLNAVGIFFIITLAKSF